MKTDRVQVGVRCVRSLHIRARFKTLTGGMGSEILTDGLPHCLPSKEQYSRLITGTLYRTSSPKDYFLRYLYTIRKGVVSN